MKAPAFIERRMMLIVSARGPDVDSRIAGVKAPAFIERTTCDVLVEMSALPTDCGGESPRLH